MKAFPVTVITGATNGIGQLAAIELAGRGAQLILTARSRERASITRDMIKSFAPDATVDFFYGDLSLMKDVRKIGSEISAACHKIDILINNAGLHGFEQRITKEGFPEMMAVNYLAPWLLTHTLLNSLTESKNARIVNVASEASRNHGKLKLPEDLTDTSAFTARGSSLIYGKTKLLNIMFTGALGRRLEGTGVTVNALNPGFNVTGLGRELRFSSALSKILNALHVGDPRKGADIILRLAVDSRYQGVTGGYFDVGTGKSIIPVYPGADIKMQNQLWDATENLLQQKGFIPRPE
jgi:NAD(P)-dependent dehydrogenase (short-subunit alcohol dehydrogenase family)